MRSVLFLLGMCCCFGAEIKTVHFRSEDRKTLLVGYLFEPSSPGPYPAVVMLHGRAGPYSSSANGLYNARTLSKRHKEWGEFWAERGYMAILVDSFGPRGYPQGFPAGSYKNRPEAVSEQTVRPFDAYGALHYLRERKDVATQHLEQFAFCVSHDLQEPLRSVKIYSELLTNDCVDAIKGEAQEYLTYLRSGATRMEMLVRDLLSYTQVAKFEKPEERAQSCCVGINPPFRIILYWTILVTVLCDGYYRLT